MTPPLEGRVPVVIGGSACQLCRLGISSFPGPLILIDKGLNHCESRNKNRNEVKDIRNPAVNVFRSDVWLWISNRVYVQSYRNLTIFVSPIQDY